MWTQRRKRLLNSFKVVAKTYVVDMVVRDYGLIEFDLGNFPQEDFL